MIGFVSEAAKIGVVAVKSMSVCYGAGGFPLGAPSFRRLLSRGGASEAEAWV